MSSRRAGNPPASTPSRIICGGNAAHDATLSLSRAHVKVGSNFAVVEKARLRELYKHGRSYGSYDCGHKTVPSTRALPRGSNIRLAQFFGHERCPLETS